MRSYHHEQSGPIYAGLLVVAALELVLGFVVHQVLVFALIALFIAGISVAFGRLSIDVGDNAVRWSMTFGWPGGVIPFDQVVSVQIVPVNFWMGIGIHLTFRGWVWNVSLGRGVQIMRPNGIAVVLGTDDPEGLTDAITRARAA